jgi:chromosome segregation ATPase
MDTDWQELEDVRKKCIELDSELDTFFQSLKEISEIRDSVRYLPEKLRQNEEEIENRKREIESMMSSTSDLLINFEEQAKGLFYDLEKKTENLAGDVKSDLSELKNIYELNSLKLHNEQKESIEQITAAYEQIKEFFNNIKSVIDHHEQSINTLNDNYTGISKMIRSSEMSIREIRITITELIKRPSEPDNRIKAVEAQLKELFFTKLEKQKNIIMWMLAAFTISIIFIVFHMMYWH